MNRKARRSRSRGAAAPDPKAVQQLIGLCRAERFAEATPLAREFTRRWPKQAVGWHALAGCAQAAGEHAEAVRAYRKALAIEPENADARNNLALLLAEVGETDAAEKEYRRATRLRPRFLQAWFNLGLLLSANDRFDEAEACYRRVLEIDPGLAEAHNSMGNDRARAGDPARAVDAYREAVRLRPSSPEFHSNLAGALHRAGETREAERHYREALRLQPGHAGASTNYGLFLIEHHRPDEAEACYRAALSSDPSAAGVRINLGHLLLQLGRMDEAEACYRQALEQDPAQVAGWNALGDLLMDAGRLDEGIECHRRACELEPDNSAAARTLGNALAIVGRPGEAEEQYRHALAIDPHDGETWYRLSQLHTFDADDPDLSRLAAVPESADSTPQGRMYALYALGKARADTGADPDSVIECWRRAGACWQAIHGDTAEQELALLDAIAAHVDADAIARLAGEGDDTRQPIFIVGMPRSGTTLVEQILASHPDVHGGGERPDFERGVAALAARTGRPFPECIEAFTPRMLGELGAGYRQSVLAPFAGTSRVTDKMPDNFRFLGLIALALPRASIIHVEREPADTCLSCFERPFFGRHAASHDLASLGRYYRGYARLMDHWRSVLPAGCFLELRYEQLVTEPEPSVRALLEHCGLPWDDRCLRFHETRRSVATASLGQVRKPLYRDSIGRWRRYRTALAPLLEALGPLAPSGDEA